MNPDDPRCPALHPDLPYSRCWRDDGHSGAHRNVSGDGWDYAPDYADGGVTAAVIEAEAECASCAEGRANGRDVRDLLGLAPMASTATLLGAIATLKTRADKAEHALADVHERDETVARLEARLIRVKKDRDKTAAQLHDALDEQVKRGKERDEALWLAKVGVDQADDALGMVARGECHDCIRDTAVTDAAVDRAWHVSNTLKEDRWPSREEIRQILTAAATPEPQRPEGAEEIEAAIKALWSPSSGVDSSRWTDAGAIADHLAERGVRVTTEDGEHTPACEGGPGLPCDTCGSYWAGDTEEES